MIIGFNYTKISIEKKNAAVGSIGIRNNVVIKDIKNADFAVASAKQKCLMFSFEFTSKYEPDIATMIYAGDILFMDSEEKLAKVMEGWNKNKQIPPEVTREVINTALAKCNVQAIVMSQEMGLPSPVPLPRIEEKQQGQQSEEKPRPALTAQTANPEQEAKPKKKK